MGSSEVNSKTPSSPTNESNTTTTPESNGYRAGYGMMGGLGAEGTGGGYGMMGGGYDAKA